MVKNMLKKGYTYFFLGAVFIYVDFHNVMLKDIEIATRISSFDHLCFFAMIFLPFLISFLISLVIKKINNEKNKIVLKWIEIVINVLLGLFSIFHCFLIYAVMHADWPVPS